VRHWRGLSACDRISLAPTRSWGTTLYSLKEDQAAYRILDFAHQLKPDDADTSELLFRVSIILANKAAADADFADSLKF
jgi:hypothetical protein